MTQQEKQEIIEAVLEALQTNSQSISQLTPVTELVDSDLFEVAGGKRVTFANIVAALLSSSGYAAATAAEQAEMWQVLMANFVATQGNESVGGVQPPLTHWSQSRVVLLKSMGAPFDDVDVSTLSVGDLIYSQPGKWIFEKLQNNLGNGIHPSDGVLYVNLATFKAYRWDGTSFQDAIKGGSGASSVTAFAQYSVVESTSELPSVGDPTTGYIVGTHIYAYVGEDGDTADGKYQDLGELNAAGVSVTTNGDGTFTIHVGDNDYTVNLNHTHENMAKLEKFIASNPPATMDNGTIYAQVDNITTPTQIESLWLFGCQFAGGAPDTGEAKILYPSNGATINLGENDGSGVSKTISVKGQHLTGDLTVEVSTGLSFDTSNLPSGVTYNSGTGKLTIAQATSLLGVSITIVFSGGGVLDDGALIIKQGNDVLSAVIVVVSPFSLSAIKLTGSQWLQTNYKPNANTEFVLKCHFISNSNTTNSDTQNAPGWLFTCGRASGDWFDLYSAKSTNPGINPPYNLFFKSGDSDNNQCSLILGSTKMTHDPVIIRLVKGQSNSTFSAESTTVDSATLPNKSGTNTGALVIGRYVAGNQTEYLYSRYDLVIYEFTITEGGTTVRNYVPATLNGVPGLYDTTGNGGFISSQTSTPVVAIE